MKSSSNTTITTKQDESKPIKKDKKKSRRVSLIFNRRKRDERKKSDSLENDIFDFNNSSASNSKWKETKQNFRSNYKTKKIETKRQARNGNKNQNYHNSGGNGGGGHRNRSSSDSRYHRKYSRLSIDDGTTGGSLGEQDSQDSGEQSRSDDTSRESSTSSNRQRKLSLTSHYNTEKIPWCGCWGNGCF